MARIAGIELPVNKRVEIALTSIYGIGISSARSIVSKINIDNKLKLKDLDEDAINKIRSIIELEYKIEGDLRSKLQMDIKRLVDMGCYRGIRHRRRLPVRGQKTKTNARTAKNRRLVNIKEK